MAEQTFKKDCDYGEEYNFAGENELMVTITLAEYRFLVEEHASERNNATKLYKAEVELDKLKETNALLRQRIKHLTEECSDGETPDESDS